jgi:hypothetical protein
MNGINELLDLFARDIAGSFCSGSVQDVLDQLYRIIAIESAQYAPVALAIERRGQRLAAGEDDTCVAGF